MAKIEGGITWGNVWSIGATLIAVAVSYATLQAGLLEGQREMKRIELQGGQATQELRLTHEKQLTDIRADLVTHRRSIQQLEISDARNSERYEALSRSMDELKAAQRETNDLLRQITSQREAAFASQRAKGLPFEHPSGISRVHWHWTGGGHIPNRTDLGAYHSLIPADGPAVHPVGPTTRRSHTLNANGGAVGVSICAMAGAVERPFNPGRAPITPAQVSGLVRETARLCRIYDIPVSLWSTLSHAEIQPTLGIVQRWKWDITWLPGMDQPGDPIAVGNRLREMVRCELLNH